MTNALLHALNTRWRQFRKEWERTRRKYSEESVHDLRVASRRLIAILDTLRTLFDDAKMEDARRRVKKSLGAFGPLRDLNVQSQYISRMVPRYGQLNEFHESLKEEETRLLKKVQKVLKKGPKLGKPIGKAKKRARREVDNESIVAVINRRYREVLRYAKKIDAENTAAIHQTRLAFKRFRYTVEVAQPLMRKRVARTRLKEFHSFQTMMGNIQDVELLLAKLAKWAKHHDESAVALEPVMADLRRQNETNIQTFLNSLGKLRSFWKQ